MPDLDLPLAFERQRPQLVRGAERVPAPWSVDRGRIAAIDIVRDPEKLRGVEVPA